MDPLIKFLEFALKGEVTTPGGWLNLAGMGLGVLFVAGTESGNLLLQLVEAASSVLDRAFHFIEKVMEFIAALARAPFAASAKPEPYHAPRGEGRVSVLLVVVGLLTVACVLALGASRYHPSKNAPHDVPSTQATIGLAQTLRQVPI